MIKTDYHPYRGDKDFPKLICDDLWLILCARDVLFENAKLITYHPYGVIIKEGKVNRYAYVYVYVYVYM